MRDYTTLHSDTDWSKGTACSKKEYGCDWTWETIQHYTVSHVQSHPYSVLLQAVPLLQSVSDCNVV
jgi:hypothetical protein